MFTLGGGGSIDTQLLKWLCNCNFSVLTSGNVHLRWGGGSIDQLWKSNFSDTQLLKWLCNCNFSVLTSGNVHLRWGGGRSTLNFWSDFANPTFLYSPLEMFTLGGGGGSIDTQLLKWLWKSNFSVLTSGNVHLRWGGGSINTQLLKWLCKMLTFLYSPLEMFTLGGGGSIDTQLLKWLCNCNFSVLTSGNIHLRWGGVDRHSTFEVTLQIQLFCTHLWKCSP